jgi:inward rectifier potassium channel
MALLKHFNKKAKADNETGLSTNSVMNGGKFFDRSGNPNMRVYGMGFFERLNVYHALLSMKRWKFVLVILIFFISINLFFAGLYLWIGIEHLNGF